MMVSGSLEVEGEGDLTLISEKILPLDEAKPGRAASVIIKPPVTTSNESYWEDLLALLNGQRRGKCQVIFEVLLPQNLRVRLAPHGIIAINGSLSIEKELRRRGCEVEWSLQQLRF